MKKLVNRACCLLVAGMVTAIVFMLLAGTYAIEQNPVTVGFGYMQTKTDAQKSAYDKLKIAILSLEEEVLLTEEEANAFWVAYHLLREDLYELFYQGWLERITMTDRGVYIELRYNLAGSDKYSCRDEALAQKAEVENKIRQILNSVPASAKTDYEKARYIHDYLAEHIEYQKTANSGNIYGALIEGKAVCGGYAKAYAVLMRRLGIETYYVTGGSSAGGWHAWNVSWIDGKCLYTDVCWDDDAKGAADDTYFMISGAKMAKDHFLDEPYDKVLAANACDHTMKLAHQIETVAGKGASCTESGWKTYYRCTVCSILFADAKGQIALETKPVVRAKGHDFGKWHVTMAPTIDAEGLESRVCTDCGHTQERVLPVLPSVEKVYATVTIGVLNVRAETSTGSARVGTLNKRQIVEILEKKTVGGKVWGRIEYGWICLTGYTTLKTVREAASEDAGDKTYATINYNYLYIRPRPGVNTSYVGTIYGGRSLRVYETVVVGSVTWGRTAFGWIWLTGYTSLGSEPGVHQEHSFGQWHVTVVPTINSEGWESRTCAMCGHTQGRTLPVLPSVEKVYATVTIDILNVRAGMSTGTTKMGQLYSGLVVEVLEQKTVGGKLWGRIEHGWICLTGYTTLKTVREAASEDAGDKTYATITCNYLSIRPQPDSSIARLGIICTNARVRIYETVTKGSVQWGRTALGWIWMTGYVDLETVKDVQSGSSVETVQKVYGTVTIESGLNIRAGAGMAYDRVGTLKCGSQVEILEQKTVADKVWGRTVNGWICLTGYVTLIEAEEDVSAATAYI